jgi:hypothetical protein
MKHSSKVLFSLISATGLVLGGVFIPMLEYNGSVAGAFLTSLLVWSIYLVVYGTADKVDDQEQRTNQLFKAMVMMKYDHLTPNELADMYRTKAKEYGFDII